MDYLKDFIVHFVGLSLGNHQFDFEVRDPFFEAFEYSQLQHGDVSVRVDLEKQDRMMVFSFTINGKVEVLCDRCGEEFMLPLQGQEQLIVKFGEEYKEESEDMIIIPAAEYKIDLSTYIYEYLHLMLPTRIVHPDDESGNSTCNPDALRRLAELAPHPATDPRWDALGMLRQAENEPQENTLKPSDKKKK